MGSDNGGSTVFFHSQSELHFVAADEEPVVW